jgi:uncharacterized protein YecE (DUF72 family)
LLSDNSFSCAASDLPHVKHLMPYTTAVTNDHAYLRLHGRNEKGWLLNGFDARYDYLYNSRELREIVRRLDVLSHKSNRVTIIFNNTTGGKAVANALQLVSSLNAGKHVLIPEATVRSFPHLHDIAAVVDGEQMLIENGGYRRAM